MKFNESFKDGDVRHGFAHTNCFRILAEIRLKFVNVISKTISPYLKKKRKNGLGWKRRRKAYIEIEMAYRWKAHKSVHTCIYVH
jgi:hypothetical protein